MSKKPRPKAADILDTPPPEDMPQEAIAFESASLRWHDIDLAPLAISREAAWGIHRHQIGSPPLSDILHNNAAMCGDAFRILWFCAHDPSDWIGVKPADLEAAINEWADANIHGNELVAAVDLAFEILDRSRKTRATIVGDGKAHKSGN